MMKVMSGSLNRFTSHTSRIAERLLISVAVAESSSRSPAKTASTPLVSTPTRKPSPPAGEKGLDIRPVDLFTFLADQPDGSLDGVLCSHVVEHLPADRLPEMIRLVAAKLEAGGVFAVETPNPGCLAIFAGDFYLDPTHQRPVPSQQLHFYLEEAGFTSIEIHERHPAPEAFPELAALDEIEGLREFRSKFFGGLDYAAVARKMKL